jgi:hypothetical protein
MNIIELAKQAGARYSSNPDEYDVLKITDRNLEHFANLVAAAARADEREECAVIAETPISGEQDDITMEAKDRIAAAIRARGTT